MKKFFLSLLVLIGLTTPVFATGKPYVTTVTLTSAGTEYSWTVPSKTTAYTMQSRTAADFKIATTEGASGTTYFTVKSGITYYEPNVENWGGVIYMQSANAGQVIEIIYWKNN